MTTPSACASNTDPLKLVREGTGRNDRRFDALDPNYVGVNEREVAHGIVFAQGYAALLKYYDETDNWPSADADWQPFFGADVAVPLAIAAIEDVEAYKSNIQSWFDYLNRLENQNNQSELKSRLGYLFAAIATLAQRLDTLKERLPPEIALKGALQNLIKNRLEPAFKRLIAYYEGGGKAPGLGVIDVTAVPLGVQVLRSPIVTFDAVLAAGLSSDWRRDKPWPAYLADIVADKSVYGSSSDPFAQINHCATHNLFKSVFDQFLKVLARVIAEGKDALNKSLTDWRKHEPHYALYLAFLQLFDYARTAGNTLTQRHLDFYYRDILRLKERKAEPGHVHLLAELAKQVDVHEFKAGELFKAGKDVLGRDAFFANDTAVVVNQAKVVGLKTLYRHGDELAAKTAIDKGRLYASPIANSADGLGAELISTDQSWHPFFNKTYVDGKLDSVGMPKADIGFAIASHYLLLAEGSRKITAEFTLDNAALPAGALEFKDDIVCLLTTEKGWLAKPAQTFARTNAARMKLIIQVDGSDPPLTLYAAKVHGYNFQTDLPVLLVKLAHTDKRPYAFDALQGIKVDIIDVHVDVAGLKTLAVSNDFGPVDTSKAFQPFGPSPQKGSSLIIGSREVFQKNLQTVSVTLNWPTEPRAYNDAPTIQAEFLNGGAWLSTNIEVAGFANGIQENAFARFDPARDRFTPDGTTVYAGHEFSLSGIFDLPVPPTVVKFSADLDKPVRDEPDFGANEVFGTQSRHGFVRLKLTGDFGQAAYQSDLIAYLREQPPSTDPPPQPPVAPIAGDISLSYTAEYTLKLDSASSEDTIAGQFFHLMPFGVVQPHPASGKNVLLFPAFEFERGSQTLASEAEFYIGIDGLKPPQNLSLLFQVVDGTANPIAGLHLTCPPEIGAVAAQSDPAVDAAPAKLEADIHWSYLRDNKWTAFAANEVQDGTDALLNSGIITFAVPREATSDNTVLPRGQIWLRAAVPEKSDAVCRLQRVATQALAATFADANNATDFAATPLPADTIKKLDTPDADVKSISQPFPSFGGRGAETPDAFYTRVSERLRHKDRSIDLWDYERLVLEAFPQIYKVKCLNHTQYDDSVYRELAPGHVTIITVPDLKVRNLRDPLKPYTSLGLLSRIEAFLQKRGACFARLHVRNPQFEEVRVNFKARLRHGFDESYCVTQLREAITRFLSPWAFAEAGAPSFGGKIYKSVLIDFVEQQPCVDYVTDFALFHDVPCQTPSGDLDEVEGSRAVSILVSAAASHHSVKIITEADTAPSGEACGCDA